MVPFPKVLDPTEKLLIVHKTRFVRTRQLAQDKRARFVDDGF